MFAISVNIKVSPFRILRGNHVVILLPIITTEGSGSASSQTDSWRLTCRGVPRDPEASSGIGEARDQGWSITAAPAPCQRFS